jgi:hypothetical protein
VDFCLHPDIDVARLAKEFAVDGRVSIQPFLPEDQAEALRIHLLERQDWRLRLGDHSGRVYDLSRQDLEDWGAEKAEAVRALIAPRIGQDGFGYSHGRILIRDRGGERYDPGTILDDFGAFMTSEPVLALARSVAGCDDIAVADGFATRYEAGDYATQHNDRSNGRRAAYVFGLTKPWRADWGGILLFHDDQGSIDAGLVPSFNVLNLFNVPRQHSVSVVAPFAKEYRLAITGWLLGKAEDE